MDLKSASEVILRTQLASLQHNTRANALLLESGPGIGKSDTVFQTAAKLARSVNKPVGLVQFMLATISSVDVRGFMLPVKGASSLDTIFSTPPWYPAKSNTHVVEPNGIWHKPGELRTATGKPWQEQPPFIEGVARGPSTWDGEVPDVGILFLDEFGQAEDDVKKAAAELLYKGAVGTTELPVGWRVIAAQNRMSDRSGVLRELMFLVNRRCRLSIDASLPAWLEWANKQTIPPHYLTISFAQQHPGIVFRESVPEGTDPFCTPRTLCLLDKDLSALRSEEDISHDRLPFDPIAREVASGWIGPGAGAQFFTHLKYSDEIPLIADIENDPARAKLPEAKDAQMVCAYMLAHNITEANAQQIMAYINRLVVEMQVLSVAAISAVENRAKLIVSEPAYVQWLMKNKELLVASRE
jgi:hypothetical protein